MSAILAIIGPRRDSLFGEHALRGMLPALGGRGESCASVWRGEGCTLAVARHPWERHASAADGEVVAEQQECLVVADASLYYRADLRRTLARAGVVTTADDASQLILAAYRAWGDDCAARLEGDFAFALYDRRRRRLLCGRDFVGSRPLFYAELPDGAVVVGSAIGTLLEHPSCDRSLDRVAIGLDAAALAFSVGELTCRKGVRRVAAGACLTAEAGGSARVVKFWRPRVVKSRVPFDDASEELLALLSAATRERMSVTAPTAMWLSGGWDSTAIFAAAHGGSALPAGVALEPVSLSHPADDCGYEDDKISATAERWGARISWVKARELAMLDTLLAGAGDRDEPVDHLFTALNRELANRSKAIGARIALDGYGGDFLFNSSNVYLADLVTELRFGRLAREWWSMKGRGYGLRHLFRYAIQPHLGAWQMEALVRLRGGRRPATPYQRSIPFWIAREFAVRGDLATRAREGGALGGTAPTQADRELEWFVTQPFYARSRAMNRAVAARGGVELRAPLLDQRLVEFAMSRPATERTSMGQGKRLLRRAMRGLLPESVLAPRPYKTGNLNGYFTASFLAREQTVRAMVSEPLMLEEIGIIDGRKYRGAVDHFFRQRCDAPFRLELTQTLMCEQWLRSTAESSRAPRNVEGTQETRQLAASA
ncbi:MAG: hypothetical protein HOQ11_02685 [Gemmatimonadaceae bacterium]|nr:hypothetical protein [Gemmatimonadaceae bacterium]NUQ91470.1 hypothetical protein [Gemmatimonadaceae bacterium]NUR20308.1 hypothetical protein [Gemmatimonadaceae bacterium]NUS96295.1 hypothetical protein [Gemmatimonadaceae bacterium]